MPRVKGYHDQDAILRREEMGRRIEFARNKLAMSKRDFAELVGVSPSSYTAWITGKSSPTMHSLSRLCEVSGVPTSFFNPEKLADVREVDRFAHELVAKLGVDRVQEMLDASPDQVEFGVSPGAMSAQIIMDAMCDKFSAEQVQDIILSLMIAHETGMLETILDSNRSVLYAVALAHQVDVELLDAQTRGFIKSALNSR